MRLRMPRKKLSQFRDPNKTDSALCSVPPLAPAPTEEKKIVFETGATRCDIGDALYHLIAPTSLQRIAVEAAKWHFVEKLRSIDHLNIAIDEVGFFLRHGQDREDCKYPNTFPLERAALHTMYAIDPDFTPVLQGHIILRTASHQLPGNAIRRVAEACGEGAKKYSPYNWEKGMRADVILDHFFEHCWGYFAGDTSEDHLGHGLWNLFAADHSLHAWPELNRGRFRVKGKPPEQPQV